MHTKYGIQGGNSSAQQHFSQLMLALESYYHPSNAGKQTVSLWQNIQYAIYLLCKDLINCKS